MPKKALSKKRQRLWKENPHCCYCGVVTIFLPAHIKGLQLTQDERHRLATIDHIRPRHHPDRLKRPEPDEVLQVLSCWKCNNERDRRELAEKPKEWFEQNGGAVPLHRRSVEDLERILPLTGAPFQLGKGRRSREKWKQVKQSQVAVLWAWWEKGTDRDEESEVYTFERAPTPTKASPRSTAAA